MKKLWVQLTLGFGLITAISVLIVALLANAQTSASFRRFLAQNQLQESGLLEQLAAYYDDNGSWAGVAQLLARVRGPGPPMGGGHGMMRGAPSLTLADAGGRIVYDSLEGPSLATLSAQERADALPITTRQGEIIGYLLAREPGGAMMPMAAQHFLDQINQSLLQAGLVAGVLGVALGLLMARGLAAPLARLAEAARRIARGQLDERISPGGAAEVAAVGQAFNEMAAALQQAETLRRQMVADIAHELRTPLSVIQGNLRAVLDDVYPLTKAEITTIYDATLGLHRLVDDLRELSLAETGQLSLHLRPVDVAPLVERSTALFAELAAEQQIAFTATLPGDLPSIQADPDRVTQILQNLLANALRHTPAGGAITLCVERSDPRLASERPVESQRDAPSLVFEVADTGPGIAAADLPHVFDRFWRADRGRARAQGGSGLGLAIVRQLVTLHGGQIGVSSTMGQGSRFWFTLPVAGSEAIGSTASGKNPLISAHPRE